MYLSFSLSLCLPPSCLIRNPTWLLHTAVSWDHYLAQKYNWQKWSLQLNCQLVKGLVSPRHLYVLRSSKCKKKNSFKLSTQHLFKVKQMDAGGKNNSLCSVCVSDTFIASVDNWAENIKCVCVVGGGVMEAWAASTRAYLSERKPQLGEGGRDVSIRSFFLSQERHS